MRHPEHGIRTKAHAEHNLTGQNITPCNLSEASSHGVLDEIGEVDFFPEQNISSPTTIGTSYPIVELYRIIVPVLIFACLLSFFFNLVIVCSSRWLRRRRISPNLLLSLSLAAADAFASLVVGLGLLLNSLLPVALGVKIDKSFNCLILTIEAFRLGSLVSTALHLLALAVNHHIGIAKPLHYARIVTRRTTLVSASAIWISPIAFFFLYFASVTNDGFQSSECSSFEFLMYSPFRVVTGLLFFIPLTAMVFIYGHIYVIVHRHQLQSNTSSDRLLKRKVKATFTTLLILGAYILGWMPAVLYFVLTCMDCPVPFMNIPLNVRVPVGFSTNALIVARCLVDPALYLIRMPDIRDALRNMFRFRTLTRNSSNTSSSRNTRTDGRRLTLLTSQRKLNGCTNGRNVIFARKEIML